MDDMTAVRRAVDRLLGGDLGPMLDLLAEDVEFEVEEGGDAPERRRAWGKQAVVDHFAALGELVAFWQIDYGTVDGQVIAWGKESFTVEGCGLEGGCEFALVFDLARGRIQRFLVIEDLRRVPRHGPLRFAGSPRGPARADSATGPQPYPTAERRMGTPW